jgi:serine kinase of HPr protein (carbohydrate metabolism regulator)
MAGESPTIHATAVLIGARAVLIRGPSGAGKSSLAWELIQMSGTGVLPFARLIGDDRVHVEAENGRLLVRPAAALAGLLEIRGLGIRRLPYDAVGVVTPVVDLSAADAARLPAIETGQTEVSGVILPRLAVAAGARALPILLAWLGTAPAPSTAAN